MEGCFLKNKKLFLIVCRRRERVLFYFERAREIDKLGEKYGKNIVKKR